jgi:hypothetical protein
VAEPRAHRITPTPRASGCDLHVQGYVADLITDLLTLLGTDADLMDRLVDVVDGPACRPDPFRPEAELPTERLVADLTDRLTTSIRVPGPALDALAGRLTAMVRAQGSRPISPLPVQQVRRAS